MFGIKKELLVTNLCKLVAANCAYSKQPCDCKYMIHEDDKVSRFSEKGNGCPETTMAAVLIAHMTEQEFQSIAKRAGITISDDQTPAMNVFKIIESFQAERNEKNIIEIAGEIEKFSPSLKVNKKVK